MRPCSPGALLLELVSPRDQIGVPPPDPPFVAARLHANELSEPWPREVLDGMAKAVKQEPLNCYPDPEARTLRRLIGREYGVDSEQVVLGAGCIELVHLLGRALAGAGDSSQRRFLVPEPTFPAYAQVGRLNRLHVISVPLRDDFQLDEMALRSALGDGGGVCFLSRPNNPTGTLWPAETLHALIETHPSTLFAVDEVYLPYAGVPSVWAAEAPLNLVVLSSLSKVGLAGERLGYAIAHREIAAHLRALQLPFRVARSAMVIGELILTRFRAVQRDLIGKVVVNRGRLAALLETLPGAVVYPSAANMVLARLPGAAQARSLVDYLRQRGILVHGFPETDRLGDCLRVTVGTAHEIGLLEQAVERWRAGD